MDSAETSLVPKTPYGDIHVRTKQGQITRELLKQHEILLHWMESVSDKDVIEEQRQERVIKQRIIYSRNTTDTVNTRLR